MTTFAEDFAAGGFDQLAEVFGVAATYTPRGGTARAITIVLWRGELDRVQNGGAVAVDFMIKNHATEGTESVSVGGDKITIAGREGEDAVTYLIQEIIEQDAGFWLVRSFVNG